VHDKIQLILTVAADHKFLVPANLLPRFGAIFATDQRLVELGGQHVGPTKRNPAVGIYQIRSFVHASAGTADSHIVHN
jgi:hypothetical protein